MSDENKQRDDNSVENNISQPDQPAQPETLQPKPKKSRKKLFIIAGVIALLIIAGLLAFLLLKPKEKPRENTPSAPQQAQQSSFEMNPIDCKPYDENQWYRTDSTFVVDPKNPQTMYVNVEWKGFYKSTDGGKTWSKKVKGIVTDNKDKTTGEQCYTEYPVAVIDPTNTNRLLLATSGGGGGTINDMNMHGGGVYESTDGAESWHQTINTTMNGYVTHALVLDPKNPQTFYYGTAASPASYSEADPNKIWVTKGVIYKTPDNGKTWQELPTGIIKNLRLSFISIDPKDSNKITASGVVMVHNPTGPNGIGKEQIGFIQSLDGGKSWKEIDNLPAGYKATFMATSSGSNGNNMFNISAVTGGQQQPKSFYSLDSGHTWKQSSNNLDYATYDPNDKTGKTLVGYSWQCGGGPCVKQLYKSTNAGASWTPFGTLPSEIKNLQDQKTIISKIVFHPTEKNTFFMTGANGYVWKTTNGGSTWKTLLSVDKLN